MPKEYTPRDPTRKILDRAWEHVQSVPYAVSARWLFYRLLQDGLYHNKQDYKQKFLPALSNARKRYYGEWEPDTLADDTRRGIHGGSGAYDKEEWLEDIPGNVARLFGPVSHWPDQDYYVEIWFEAKAMAGQFRHYTDGVTLRPFGGDPSIPFKYQIAEQMGDKAEDLKKEVVALYFGDRDDKGEQIDLSALADIRDWCAVPITMVRGGLSMEQASDMDLQENPDKPGTYQWEALTDEQAREIINTTVDQYVDRTLVKEAQKRAEEWEEKWRPCIEAGIEEAIRRGPE